MRRMPVSGPLICAQALRFASDLGIETFKASTGWLASFLSRNNIVLGTMSCERGDVNKDTVYDWKEKLPTLCEGYEPMNIFNMDETGLFFRDTTRKSYHFKETELAGGKRSKERITVALCASMTGEKLPPLVIGKSAKPRCFGKIKTEKLPVMYRNNKKAWMNTELMKEWLKSVDQKMRRQGRKVLLFLDNAPSHPKISLQNVKIVFFPANTTSLSQPMDQGIIQTLKLKYRKRQLQYILTQMENDKVGSHVLQQISILDAIYWINGSWKDIEVSTIQKCFARCGFAMTIEKTDDKIDEDSDIDEDDVPLAVLKMSNELSGVSFSDLVEMDKCAPVCETETSGIDWEENAADILKSLKSSENVDENDEDEVLDTGACADETVTMDEACDMEEKLKRFALTMGQDKMLTNIMELQELFVASRCEVHSKQTKIEDFFAKKAI
ncbi:tigger transposable element-derived protein 4-like [Dreissena polymorpha]|uniref:tigger transposable element-derived protein 4-like n=1 Tax=Dreissena polymorpha TaxID=45954 RepID=UPI002264388D|nr:tigger transposable element-derived protein 4-like [Dreissena polymorpha]